MRKLCLTLTNMQRPKTFHTGGVLKFFVYFSCDLKSSKHQSVYVLTTATIATLCKCNSVLIFAIICTSFDHVVHHMPVYFQFSPVLTAPTHREMARLS